MQCSNPGGGSGVLWGVIAAFWIFLSLGYSTLRKEREGWGTLLLEIKGWATYPAVFWNR